MTKKQRHLGLKKRTKRDAHKEKRVDNVYPAAKEKPIHPIKRLHAKRKTGPSEEDKKKKNRDIGPKKHQ